MASNSEIPPQQGLLTFKENIKTYCSKIESGEISAVPELIQVIKEIHLALQSDAEIDLTELRVITDCLVNLVRCLLEQHGELQESHDELQVSIQDLDDRVKKLENLEEILLIGQIASKVEKVFVEEIVNGTNVSDSYFLTIDQLDYALSDLGRNSRLYKNIFESEEEVSTANDNWDRLESTFWLDTNLYCAIKSLKLDRNNMAHPGMSVREARGRLANCSKRDTVYRLLDILDRAFVENIETFPV